MGMIPIGVATSVSKKKQYHSIDTLQFCVENCIKLVQIYLNQEILENSVLLKEIYECAMRWNIQVTCHLPTLLNFESASEKIIRTASILMSSQKQKKIIVHFNEYKHGTGALEVILKLNNCGFTVCIENYFIHTDTNSIINNIKNYSTLFVRSKQMKLSVVPVIDFPRLFISDIFRSHQSYFFTERLCSMVGVLNLPIILHVIDFLDYSNNREQWCVLGKGRMPYAWIFSLLKERDITVDHLIFEYEDTKMCQESIAVFSSLY